MSKLAFAFMMLLGMFLTLLYVYILEMMRKREWKLNEKVIVFEPGTAELAEIYIGCQGRFANDPDDLKRGWGVTGVLQNIQLVGRGTFKAENRYFKYFSPSILRDERF